VSKKQNRINRKRKIYDKQDGLCAYCLEKIKFEDATIDHVIPKSKLRRKKYQYMFLPENLVISCHKCNQNKGSKLINPKLVTMESFCIDTKNLKFFPVKD
jgi:uncharacterized protein (TIGR02646 family)